MSDTGKFCFVVSPIGPKGSETRKLSDGYLQEIIKPVAEEAGYGKVERADHDKSPGMVTDAIVKKLIEADLVIADLRDHNPNVMYEVAIRHARGAPIIQMIPEGEKLPFDIVGLNTIEYDESLNGAERWRSDLRTAMQAVERGESGQNPVSRAAIFRGLEARDDDISVTLAAVLTRMGRIEDRLLANVSGPHEGMKAIGEFIVRAQDRELQALVVEDLRKFAPDLVFIQGVTPPSITVEDPRTGDLRQVRIRRNKGRLVSDDVHHYVDMIITMWT